jgi:hypothetical protein
VPEFSAILPVASVLLGGLFTYLGMIHSQHLTTAREREARKLDAEAERLRAHNRFQAKTLMAAQRLAARVIQRSVDFGNLRDGIQRVFEFEPDPKKLEANTRAAAADSWNTINELALLRERIVNDDLRSRLKKLEKPVGKYRNLSLSDAEKHSLIVEMDGIFKDANSLLGEVLRKLI